MNIQPETDQAVNQNSYYNDYWSGNTGWRPQAGMDPDLAQWLNNIVRPGTTVVDIGCGDGSHYASYLVSAGLKVHGLDVSDVGVNLAREKGIDAQVASLDQPLPFADASFDSAMCMEVLEHLVDPEFTAREIYRVLKPNGLFLTSVPNTGFWVVRLELLLTGHFNPKGNPVTQKRYPWRDPHLRFFNSLSFRNMLQDVGFEVEQQGGAETQFLEVAGLEKLFHSPATQPVQKALRAVGAKFHGLLARRCVIVARKPSEC